MPCNPKTLGAGMPSAAHYPARDAQQARQVRFTDERDANGLNRVLHANAPPSQANNFAKVAHGIYTPAVSRKQARPPDEAPVNVEALGDDAPQAATTGGGSHAQASSDGPQPKAFFANKQPKRAARSDDDDDSDDRPQQLHVSDKRPSHIPPGCHVCNVEITLYSEGDLLTACDHPDGCGKPAHIDTCSKICPDFPGKTICDKCYCPGKVLAERPELVAQPACPVSSGIVPSERVWSLLDPPLDPASAHPGGNPIALDRGATISAEQLCQLGWKWSPQVIWSAAASRFQGQVLGSPASDPRGWFRCKDDAPLQPLSTTHSQCHVCNPYCVHNSSPDVTQDLGTLLCTAQNLAECHNMLSPLRHAATDQLPRLDPDAPTPRFICKKNKH